jgi:competence protein ComEA
MIIFGCGGRSTVGSMKTRVRTDSRGPGRRSPRGRHRRPLPHRAHARAAALFGPDPDPGAGSGPDSDLDPGTERADPVPSRAPGSNPAIAAVPRAVPDAVGETPAPVPPEEEEEDEPARHPAMRLRRWLQGRCAVEPRTLAAVCVVLAIAIGFAVHHYWTGRPQTVTADRAAPAGLASAAEPSPSAGAAAFPSAGEAREHPVVIDIAGEVAEPGVRTLPPGSRVADAIEAAGGAVPGTDTEGINRARILTDGEHLLVGGEPEPGPGGGPAAPRSGGITADGRISLNSATIGELEQLPGVGPVLAGNIASYREQHGRFTSVDQLLSVSGIGDGRLAELRDRVVL